MGFDLSQEVKTAPKVAVVYLDRWKNPSRFAAIFLNSLIRYPAGADFDIIWQMKGYPEGAQSQPLKKFRKLFRGAIHELRYGDDLYQFSLSVDAVQKFEYDYFLFFISWSRILAPNWLEFYLQAFADNPNSGIVGASGSFELQNADQMYPNVHIRTNAYMVSRKLYLSLDFGLLDSKAAGYLVEAGPNSITKQIVNRGLEVLIVNRFGASLRPSEWAGAQIFRSGIQDALLVADNQTYAYAKSTNQNYLAQLAWRDKAEVTKVSFIQRALTRLRWHAPAFAERLGL